jgi:hypothetical protein
MLVYFAIIIVISFIVSVFLSKLAIDRTRNGYRFGTMLVSVITGGIALLVSFVAVRTVLSWLTLSPNLLNSMDWKSLINEFFISIRKVIDLEINELFLSHFFVQFATTGSLETHWIYFFQIGIIIFLSIWSWTICGNWYRTDWKSERKHHRDWLDIVQRLFYRSSTNIILQTLVLNLFRNRLQLSHHFTYFFYHYSNYMFIGAAIGAMDTVDRSSPILRLLVVFVIFNAISRDAFEAGTTLFPGIIRFDGEGKSIALYRITGTDLRKVYNQKISLQRRLGLLEFTLSFSIISFILEVKGLELLFILSLVFLNFLCIPHLKLLPSFASPHFNKQHYSESEDFEEQEIWEDSIESKLLQFLTIAIISPMLMMILFDFTLDDMYLVGAVIITLLSIIIYIIIRILIKKISSKINKADLI